MYICTIFVAVKSKGKKMLKLILYEWKKLWKNASVLKILLLFWVLSGVIFQGELNQDKEAHQTYLEFHKATDNMTEKEAENWLLEQQEKGLPLLRTRCVRLQIKAAVRLKAQMNLLKIP